MRLYDTPRVGGDVLAYCTKCKMELAHVVIAMLDTQPARVECKTCKGAHNFRRQSSVGASTRSKSQAAAKPRQTLKVSVFWEEKLTELKNAKERAYKTTESFKKNEVLSHPNFGIGVVLDVRAGGKILVLFKDAERILVSALVP